MFQYFTHGRCANHSIRVVQLCTFSQLIPFSLPTTQTHLPTYLKKWKGKINLTVICTKMALSLLTISPNPLAEILKSTNRIDKSPVKTHKPLDYSSTSVLRTNLTRHNRNSLLVITSCEKCISLKEELERGHWERALESFP